MSRAAKFDELREPNVAIELCGQHGLDPDLKEFIDFCLVPMLVRDALCEISDTIHLAAPAPIVGKSVRCRG
jgi:hypothetical protein